MPTIEFYTEQKMTPSAKEVLAYAVREVYGTEKVSFKKVPVLKEGVLSFGKKGKGVYTLSPKQIPVVPNAVSVLTQSLKVHRDGYPLPPFRYQVISDALDVSQHLPGVLDAAFDKPVSLDTEWDKDGHILCLSMYYPNTNMVTVFSEEVMQDPEARAVVYEFIQGHYYTIWANGKADQVAIELDAGVRVPCWFDTMLAHHSLHPSASGQHGLKEMVLRYFGVEDWDKEIRKYSHKGKDDVDFGRVPRHLLYKYNAYDSFYTYHLEDYFEPLVVDRNAFWTEVMWANYFVDVEVYGNRVDLDAVNDLRDNLMEKEAVLEETLREYGIENPRSPKQILTALRRYIPKLTGTDKKVLEQHKTVPVVAALLEYRKYNKQRATYCDAYLRAADDNGVFHPTFNVHGTGSGRMSGSNPNTTNVPRAVELRNLYIPHEGHVLISTDLAQAELRIQAVLSGDPALIAAFAPDAGDFFDNLMPAAFPDKFEDKEAYETFKKTDKPQAKDLRAKLKGVVYGLNFGRGAAAIGEAIEMATSEAQKIIDNFFNAYPVWAEWRKKVEKAAVDPEERDFLTTILGLTFDTEVITGRNRAGVQRSALSFLPQGNVAYIAVTGMCMIIDRLKRDFPEAHVVNFVHDDIIVSGPPEQAEQIGLMMKQCLETAGRVAFGEVVSFEAEPDSGPRWGSLLG
jgi:DNA polymerase I-like protein with 3'-5' exonuclease and polymerase domains